MSASSDSAAKPRRAAVYRLWDSEGNLLYIGSAYDPDHRCQAHRQQPWWPAVTRRTEEWHAGRRNAYIAELEAIAKERPTHNLMGTLEYQTPSTEKVQRRNELAPLRGRLTREADLLAARVTRESRAAGASSYEAERAGKLAAIDFLEDTGLFDGAVKWRRRQVAYDARRHEEEQRDDS
ncbi:GIY-YIG nuclease family protein [Streptomyces qinglanensis]|uniref:GIY-YIG catalytic domain-containing protein n=1 Tax=Streptomyces qinglanensis TaxID=943816 RepID=A0A1H9U459_9ACTN|nr:GIY-YIG nuclease family protein [Streptomyces qinglanensis]SES03863.1 GIY-YIG catalytic domain-containing protein [Streptomyces qinglanensis]